MKKFILLVSIFGLLFTTNYAQRVQGTARKVSNNEVIISIKPTASFTAQITNLVFAIQIPKTVSATRPQVTITNLQPSLFLTYTQLNQDQGDNYYTYGFNNVDQGSGNTATTTWPATELDVLKISFLGPTSAPFIARLCHYLDGGVAAAGPFALFYIETSLSTVNGGVLSNWGSLFYGTGASNGPTALGNIGVPNALYSYFPVADVVLPTKFLSFYANKSDDNAKLTWTVDNEEDNSYFEVEASTDARTFKMVQKVNSLHNGRSSNTYNLTDNRISRYSVGTIYYRIRQVEANGRIIYSDVRQVTIDGKNFVAALYPNPVKTITRLVIEAPEAGKATVIIRDAAGKAVKQMNLQLQKGTNQQDLDASAFAAGDYNITIVSDKLNQTIKLTKSN